MQSRIRIASPCSASWEQMEGDARVRHCAQCDLDVYNFSAMTEQEVAALRSTHTGRICGRLYRRADGTMLTQDCPVGARLVRISHVAGAALSVAVGLGTAMGQAAPSQPPNSAQEIQAEDNNAHVTIWVTDSSGAMIPNASVSLFNQATQAKIEGRTDFDGRVYFGSVNPAAYALIVEANGFQSHTLALQVSARQAVENRVELDVSSVAEMGVIVESSDAEVHTIDANLVQDRIVSNAPAETQQHRPGFLKRLISKLGL